MPAVVTFDVSGPGLFIREIDTGGDNELDLTEIYSEWKDWTKLSDNLKYPPAFRQVGSDPITDIQNLGTTFFLNTGDGWQIKPAERSHLLQINGNLFTDPAGLNPIAPTDGAYTVLVRMFVSNLVDAAVARLDLNQLLQSVYIDVANGVAGTGDTVGTPTNPVNNLTDALTLAAARTIKTFTVRGNLTIDQDVSGYNFVGETGQEETTISMSGYDFNNCNFTACELVGAMTGRIEAASCRINLTTGLDGLFQHCGLAGNYTIAAGADATFADCFSEIAGDSRVVMTVAGINTFIGMRNYSGGLEVQGLTTGCALSFDGDPGKLVAGATNTAGEILIRGSSTSDFTGLGAGVTVVDDRFSSLLQIVDGATTSAEVLKRMNAWIRGRIASEIISGIETDIEYYAEDDVEKVFENRINDSTKTRTPQP